MKRTSVVIGLLLGPLTGCGLIVHGTSQTVFLNSDPQSAEVRTGPRELQYWTPTTMELGRKHDYQLTFELAGYLPATLVLRRHLMSEIVVLDVIGTAGIGLIADGITGALYRLEPGSPIVTLVPNPVAPTADGLPVTIDVRTDQGGKVSIGSSQPRVSVRVASLR